MENLGTPLDQNNAVFRNNRRLAYTCEASFPEGKLDKTECKVLTLKENPSLDAGWEPVVVSFHDDGSRYLVGGEYNFGTKTPLPEWQAQLFAILAGIYDFGSQLFKNWANMPPHEQLALVQPRLGTVTIAEYHALRSEKAVQEWKMEGAWPHSVNFGNLCYSSDPSTDVEITWRFQKCTHTTFESPQ